jgi:hypothetical protein
MLNENIGCRLNEKVEKNRCAVRGAAFHGMLYGTYQ